MTLRNVIKGHKADRCVVITNGRKRLEWSGKGMEHIIDSYKPEWFDRTVLNTTKDYCGKTIIIL